MTYMRGVVRSAPLALAVALVVVLAGAAPAGAFPVGGGGGDDPPPDCVADSTGSLWVSPTNPVAGQNVTVGWSVVQDSGCTVWKFVDGPGFSGAGEFLSNSGSRTVRVDTQGFNSWTLSVTGPARNTYPLASASATAGPGPQYGWGLNTALQINPSEGALESPTQVRNQGMDVIQEFTGGYGVIALHSDGSVWTWGNSWILGDGSTTDRYWEGRVPVLPHITQVADGIDNMLALDSSGTVWAWGRDASYQDGPLASQANGQRTPVKVPLPGPAVQVAQGTSFGMALLATGDVYAWGTSTYGELADGGLQGQNYVSATPVKALNLAGITQIAAGGFFGLALAGNGTLYAWGLDSNGQLGPAGTVGSNSRWPIHVAGPTGITHLAAGPDYAMALTAAGTVVAWGADYIGQVGDGQTQNADPNPVVVPLPAAATQIAVSEKSGFALLADGTVWSWGLDLRDSTFQVVLRGPAQLTGLPRVAWLTAGYFAVIVSLAQ